MLHQNYSLVQHRNRVMLIVLRSRATFSTAATTIHRAPARPQLQLLPLQKQRASGAPMQARVRTRQLRMASFVPGQAHGYVRTSDFARRIILWGVFVGPCLVVFYCWSTAKNKGRARMNWMLENFALSQKNINEGRWWTLITSAFSHMDPVHLLFNMLTLRFGVEAALAAGLGPLRVLLLATGAALSSSYASLWDEESRKHGSAYHRERVGLGASGMVEGFLAAMALTRPWMHVSVMLIPVPIPLPVVWGLFTAWDYYNLSLTRKHGDNPAASGPVVGYAAHLGGSTFGALYWFVRLRPVFGGMTLRYVQSVVFRR